jgi:hypothetical protein
LCAAAVLAVVTVTTAFAQPFDKRTFFTFTGPVAIPGVTLPAGKYLFRIVDSSSRNVVQVLSEDGTTPYAMFFAIPAERLDPADDPEIRFMETATGMPTAVKTWWYPGQRTGYEFLYPKRQARLLARGAGYPVLTTEPETATPPETRTAELARISPSGEQTPPEVEPAAPVGPTLVGELAPPTIAIPEQREALPRTASGTPAIALVGLILLLGAVAMRGLGLVRG